ncbi:nicotinamidase [Ectothiorhodospira mobilis]|uniref:nicotinamidase n=1 Tax=Ectothiorhodospira mobilis TaxID=195064 RepID=UPI001EE8F544|nr:nicotinamidase [Ectothiorhodospira mobilis]MCG5534862.1 nicotinamidase [Ectothiorhodospira mobilis]
MGDAIDAMLRPGDALLVVDVQNDFCPGGRLPIPQGDRVIPVLNRALEAARARGLPVYASRDWHPAHHPSFAQQGGPWPPHCLQDTPGAAFHPDLDLPAECIIVTKGTRFDKDQYSAFDETGLAEELRRRGVQRLWIGGLAEDVCVEATALDAVGLGFGVALLPGGALPVTSEGGEQARARMARAGVVLQPGQG